MRRSFKNSFNRQCIVKLDWKFKRIRRAKSRDIPNLKRIKIKIKIKTILDRSILDRSILHFPYLEILYLQSSRSSPCKLILARDLRKWVQRELPRRINEIYAGKRVKWAQSIRSSPRIYFYRDDISSPSTLRESEYNFFSNFARFQWIFLYTSYPFFLLYRTKYFLPRYKEK